MYVQIDICRVCTVSCTVLPSWSLFSAQSLINIRIVNISHGHSTQCSVYHSETLSCVIFIEFFEMTLQVENAIWHAFDYLAMESGRQNANKSKLKVNILHVSLYLLIYLLIFLWIMYEFRIMFMILLAWFQQILYSLKFTSFIKTIHLSWSRKRY